LDKRASGKTNAALATKTKPSRIELTAIDVPGLHIREKKLKDTKNPLN